MTFAQSLEAHLNWFNCICFNILYFHCIRKDFKYFNIAKKTGNKQLEKYVEGYKNSFQITEKHIENVNAINFKVTTSILKNT